MRGYVGKTFYAIEGIGHVGSALRQAQGELAGGSRQNTEVRDQISEVRGS
jgi:hypothetical protein